MRGTRDVGTLSLRLLASFAVMCGVVIAAQADAIRGRLDKARADTEASLKKADAVLLQRFDELIQLRRKDGRLDELQALQAAREAFENEGKLPELPAMTKSVKTYQSSRNTARRQLLVSLKSAISDYTRAKRDAEAERLQVERDELAAELEGAAGPAKAKNEELAPGELDPRGKPFNYRPGEIPGIIVWVEENGTWCVRFSSDKTGHIHRGMLTIRNGQFQGTPVAINVGQGKAADFGRMANPSTFQFEFRTPRFNEDGFNFRIRGPNATVTLDVKDEDGNLEPRFIHVGRDGLHPAGLRFELSNRFTGKPVRP